MTSIRDEVHKQGFAFRSAYGHDVAGEALAHYIGAPIVLGSSGPVHVLAPAPAEQRAPNSYSRLYGFGAFPLHTDLAHHRFPPRYLMLRSIVPALDVGTLLVDGDVILATVGRSLLARALVQPRRPRAGVRPLLRLYDPAQHLIRWDCEFIQPASEAGSEAIIAVTATLSQQEPIAIRLAAPGDVLVIDNWRMLHGRTTVSQADRGRRIERAYLENLH